VRTHKKPINPTPSKLLTKFAEEIALNSKGPIIDVACGYGRNAVHISSLGVPVLCIDNNKDALGYIESLTTLSQEQHDCSNHLTTLEVDLINDPWPFKNETLGAIINVHFFTSNLLHCFMKSLCIGGYLFIETIDGHGGNYLKLPPLGFIKETLSDAFEIRFYNEKKVGPPQSNASTVKLLAIKRKHPDFIE